MIRQLKYKIRKNCTTRYIGAGRGSGGGNFFMRTLDCRRKLERGGGGKGKPFSISTLPFPLLFPFLVSPAMNVMHGHLEQRYCWKCNIPDLTRHGCCHQVSWNLILLSWNIITDYCVSLKSLSILYSRYFDLQKITWAAFFVSYFTPFYHFITRGQKVSDSFMC